MPFMASICAHIEQIKLSSLPFFSGFFNHTLAAFLAVLHLILTVPNHHQRWLSCLLAAILESV